MTQTVVQPIERVAKKPMIIFIVDRDRITNARLIPTAMPNKALSTITYKYKYTQKTITTAFLLTPNIIFFICIASCIK